MGLERGEAIAGSRPFEMAPGGVSRTPPEEASVRGNSVFKGSGVLPGDVLEVEAVEFVDPDCGCSMGDGPVSGGVVVEEGQYHLYVQPGSENLLALGGFQSPVLSHS